VTEHSTRAIRFAAAYALLRMAADVGDHWINAAKAMSTFPGVSVPSTKLVFRANCGLGGGVAVVASRRTAPKFTSGRRADGVAVADRP
jgi:hypothetical protein